MSVDLYCILVNYNILDIIKKISIFFNFKVNFEEIQNFYMQLVIFLYVIKNFIFLTIMVYKSLERIIEILIN